MDRRKGKGRRCCLGDVLECHTKAPAIYQPQCCGAGHLGRVGEKAPAPGCCCETLGFCDDKVATILKILVSLSPFLHK